MAPKKGSGPPRQIVADNRKARFNFEIMDTFEAGLQLTGSEVKSLRSGRASLGEAYASVEGDGQLYLISAEGDVLIVAVREEVIGRDRRESEG